jgi:ABC-2 type transport system permease protein
MNIRTTATALRYASTSALADLSVIYTWKTWTFGWLVRVLCQVAFFAFIGKLIGSPDTTNYLLIGNAVLIATMESAFVVASTTWERGLGTLPLLVAAPASLFTVFAGRSIQWIISGVTCANIALFGLAPLFGIHLDYPSALLAIPLTIAVSLSSYCFALALAGVVLRATTVRNIVGNLAWWSVALVGGVQVPVGFWPAWVRAASEVLPLRHGLDGVRTALSGGSLRHVGLDFALECAVGLGWLLVASLSFRWLAEGGRRTGSIEFGE